MTTGSRGHDEPSDRTLQGVRSLVARAQSGDSEALGRLFDLHEPMLIRWARRRLGQPLRTLDETRDVLHDAYGVALTRIASFEFEDNKSFARWMRGIITRVVLRKAGSPHIARRRVMQEEGELSDPDLTPMSRLSLEEMKHARYRFLKEFPRTDRIIFRLKTRGCSSSEIALRVGMSDRAVRMRFAKTKARIRLKMLALVEGHRDER